jgi:hypothetical protein
MVAKLRRNEIAVDDSRMSQSFLRGHLEIPSCRTCPKMGTENCRVLHALMWKNRSRAELFRKSTDQSADHYLRGADHIAFNSPEWRASRSQSMDSLTQPSFRQFRATSLLAEIRLFLGVFFVFAVCCFP